MAWSATKTSTGAGNWNTAGIWNPNGVPTDTDYVQVMHHVHINTDAVCAGLYVDGAVLAGNSGQSLTISDVPGTHAAGEQIRISDDGDFDSEGTRADPFVFANENVPPTYPTKMMIMKKADPDTRTLDFSYTELRGFAQTLGNETNYVFFNTGDPTRDGVMEVASMLNRSLKIDEIYCQGRSYGRVYPEGGHAGVIELSGMVTWASRNWEVLAAMRDARERVAYIGQFTIVPKAYIEALKVGGRNGPYAPISITVVEDK